MHLRVRSFQHSVVAPGLLILAVSQYPTVDRLELPRIKNLDWQAFIRYRDAMSRERPLPISGSLHSPKDLFDVVPYVPGVWPYRFSESHALQYSQTMSSIVARASPDIANPVDLISL